MARLLLRWRHERVTQDGDGRRKIRGKEPRLPIRHETIDEQEHHEPLLLRPGVALGHHLVERLLPRCGLRLLLALDLITHPLADTLETEKDVVELGMHGRATREEPGTAAVGERQRIEKQAPARTGIDLDERAVEQRALLGKDFLVLVVHAVQSSE